MISIDDILRNTLGTLLLPPTPSRPDLRRYLPLRADRVARGTPWEPQGSQERNPRSYIIHIFHIFKDPIIQDYVMLSFYDSGTIHRFIDE